MSNITLSIIGNKILHEVLSESKLFSKYNINFYDNFDLCKKNIFENNYLLIFFYNKLNEFDYEKLIEYRSTRNNFPLILINKSLIKKNSFGEFNETFNIPFSISNLEKKIVYLLGRYEFSKRSLISFYGYTIDRNEKKIKKNDIELQLTEKEISFLILFSENNKPVSRRFILKNVWNYSSETDTHTVETHIHRLRKKLLEKFGDKNFIKNNNKGYYI